MVSHYTHGVNSRRRGCLSPCLKARIWLGWFLEMTTPDNPTRDSFLKERKSHRHRLRDAWRRLKKCRDMVFPSEFSRIARRIEPFTMVGYDRLKGIYSGVIEITAKNITGDLVECGTAKGGSAGLMRLTAQATGQDRPLWVYDTFEGLPMPSRDNPDFELAKARTGTCRGDFEEVRGLFDSLGVLKNTQMIKGLFQDTLPQHAPEHISLLHLDGDWYESTKVCLDHLYDRVSSGGVIQIDDYGHWAGARQAVHEFLDARNLKVELRYLDYSGRQFIKP